MAVTEPSRSPTTAPASRSRSRSSTAASTPPSGASSCPGVWFYDPAFDDHRGRRRAPSPSSTARPGILRYRGYPIEQLAEQSTYLEVAYLLIHGELPTPAQFETWDHDITYHTFIHENVRKRFMEGFHYDAHPMGMLVSAIAALSTFYPDAKDIHDPDDPAQADRPAHRQDADAGRLLPTASAWACRSSTRTTRSTSPRTSCR